MTSNEAVLFSRQITKGEINLPLFKRGGVTFIVHTDDELL